MVYSGTVQFCTYRYSWRFAPNLYWYTPYRQTDSHLAASFPGQPGCACTRKVKPIWTAMNQEMTEWQWHQLDLTQIIRTLIQMDNHVITSTLFTGQMLFLVPNQQCQSTGGQWVKSNLASGLHGQNKVVHPKDKVTYGTQAA